MTAKEIAQYYRAGTLGSFSTGLMDLIGKADVENRVKLAVVYPEYLHAHMIWFNGDDQDDQDDQESKNRIKRCEGVVEYPKKDQG